MEGARRLTLMHPDDDSMILCPSCAGMEGHCRRCHGHGHVKVASLDDDERFAAGLMPDTIPSYPYLEALD